jgi:acetylornithine deacetylase
MGKKLKVKAIELLKLLIQTPSFSKQEDGTAIIIKHWLEGFNIETNRLHNNVWCKNLYFDETKPTILLNSHHDTVLPNKAYTNDPFNAFEKDGKLYGLGSNDAGGSLVSLLSLFVHFYREKELKFNLIIAATAEEEISGENGISSIIQLLPRIDFAVVGEPTEMQLAISEKGLLVIDGFAEGISGHAAHENSENSIYKALQDIEWIRTYEFPKKSETLGKVKMTVTQINAGTQHNVIPDSCHFVVDVRVTDVYTNEAVFDIINKHTKSKMVARSFRLNSSSISKNHPIVRAGIELGRKTYGSPTISDQALLSCPSLKLGPGVSKRSHSADEFIEIKEIEEGIELYIQLFNKILK